MARKTQEQFENEVYELYGDEYTVLGKYIGADKKVLIRHNVCGNEWKAKPSNLLNTNSQNHGCPKCANNQRLDGDFILKEFSKCGFIPLFKA
ncbi:hypothetical protein [Clostridium sp.]|uniref:hypothetical protein n=1 Tax=Clostridium sp. TaxID=1506 RepID=UPI00262E1FF2|nr:hypothetical protein [Clostridium sp.]